MISKSRSKEQTRTDKKEFYIKLQPFHILIIIQETWALKLLKNGLKIFREKAQTSEKSLASVYINFFKFKKQSNNKATK